MKDPLFQIPFEKRETGIEVIENYINRNNGETIFRYDPMIKQSIGIYHVTDSTIVATANGIYPDRRLEIYFSGKREVEEDLEKLVKDLEQEGE